MRSSTKHTTFRHGAFALAVVGAILLPGCEAPDEGLESDEAAHTAEQKWEKGEKLSVTATSLALRSGAGTKYRAIVYMKQDSIVTVLEDGGDKGWVNVETSDKQRGWASTHYLASQDAFENGIVKRVTRWWGKTCSPSRAEGAVNKFQQALHDAIAFSEGTFDRTDNDGYDLMFGYNQFYDCKHHPNKLWPFRDTRGTLNYSSAAGRYQFIYKTWNYLRDDDWSFEPNFQELATVRIIAKQARVSIPKDRAMTATEFQNAMKKMSGIWASLPYSTYHQPKRTLSQVRTAYCGQLPTGCR